jgi:hypothetical protein
LEIQIRIEQPVDAELFQSFEPLFTYLDSQSIYCNRDTKNNTCQFSFHRLATEQTTLKKSIFFKSESLTHHLICPSAEEVDLNSLFEPLKKIELPFQWNSVLWVHQLENKKEQEFLKTWSRFAFQSDEWHLVDSDLTHYLKELKYKQGFWQVALEDTYKIVNPLLYGVYNGIIAYEWFETKENQFIACPLHGRVKELEGMGIINPIASLLALCALIERANQPLAEKMRTIVLHSYFLDKENTTPDRGGILNTSTYIRKLVEKLYL